LKPEDVPAGPLLVDTDVFSYFAKRLGPHEAFASLVVGHLLLLSFVTVGEVMHGAIRAKWGAKKLEELEQTFRRYVVVPGTDEVARQYARVSARYEGRVGANDIWIAACALAVPEHPPLVTNDADFEPIAQEFGLILVRPEATSSQSRQPIP